MADNTEAYEDLAWIVDHAEGGFFAVVAHPDLQREIVAAYSANTAVYDFRAEKKRAYYFADIAAFMQAKPGKRAWFLQNFQDVVLGDLSEDAIRENLARLNFSRDMLADLGGNLVFCMTEEARKRINRGAHDFFTFFKLLIPFKAEVRERSFLMSDAQLPPEDMSMGNVEAEIPADWPEERQLTRAITYSRWAREFMKQFRFQDALKLLNIVREVRERWFGDWHPETAVTYEDLGTVYWKMRHPKEALEWFRKTLRIYEDTLGENSIDVAEICHYIGWVCRDLEEYSSALDWHQKSLEIKERILGTEHLYTATSYGNIGGAYYNMGDYPDALEWGRKALAIQEKVLGTEHPDTAVTYNNIGTIYYDMGDYPMALEWQKKALAIREKVLGPEHPDTKQSYRYLAMDYEKLDDKENAKKYFALAGENPGE